MFDVTYIMFNYVYKDKKVGREKLIMMLLVFYAYANT